ncbi:MAG: type 4a pilus biogenesis protein PilO [Candidatus Omnitrophota bacterium]
MNYSREELVSLINENKEKIISMVVIIAALIIAVSIYKDQSRKLQLLNTERDIEIKKNIVLNDIKQSEKKIEFYKNLLSEKAPSAITSKIKDIAMDASINIISIQSGSGEQKPLYTEYPFVLTIGAQSYHAIGNFISKIENYSDLYSVHTVSIVSSGESQASDKLIVDLTLTVIAFTG